MINKLQISILIRYPLNDLDYKILHPLRNHPYIWYSPSYIYDYIGWNKCNKSYDPSITKGIRKLCNMGCITRQVSNPNGYRFMNIMITDLGIKMYEGYVLKNNL